MTERRNLAAERTRLGMTQAECAERLDCTAKSLSIYERGEASLPSDIAIAAADLFGCSTDYLFGRTDDRLPRTA